jgi:Mor family transcriptional regulator
METKVKKYRESIAAKIVDEFRSCTGSKSVKVYQLATKYHVSISTVYNYIRRAKSN